MCREDARWRLRGGACKTRGGSAGLVDTHECNGGTITGAMVSAASQASRNVDVIQVANCGQTGSELEFKIPNGGNADRLSTLEII